MNHQGICVFDLDNTLGDFRGIDFFGLLLEPKVIPNHSRYSKLKKYAFSEIINDYSKEEKDLLIKLRNNLEKELEKEDINKKVFRPQLKEILTPLVNQFKKHTIKGFIIYSNNANLYALEYAGRAIENMFNTPELFIKYLDRNHEERIHDRPDHSGYPSKMVKTIRKYSNIKSPILFVDDLIHNDFYIDYENTTYIIIPAYESNMLEIDLQFIISIFEDILDNLSEKERSIFYNIYHIKETLKISDFKSLEAYYLQYSKEISKPREFKENMPMIKEKINSFIKKLSLSGGKRKTRKFKNKNKRLKLMINN